MYFKVIACLLSIFALSNANAQKQANDTLIASIKTSVTAFFVKNHALTEEGANGSRNPVYVTEVVEQKAIGHKMNGIYRIGIFKSHSEEHILIKEGSQFRIFDIKKIDEALKEVINYCSRNKINVDIMFSYIKKIMEMYDYNYKFIPNSAGKMPVTDSQP
jgi:hypothetical protein